MQPKSIQMSKFLQMKLSEFNLLIYKEMLFIRIAFGLLTLTFVFAIMHLQAV